MSKLDEIFDEMADYLPDECAGLNHNDLPETKAAVKALILDLIDEAESHNVTETGMGEELRHEIGQL